ncbi:cyclic nucleotide-binding domain-containing protein [Pedobacter sp. MC2016-14]|uniref:Crp/Fnr family transcriptional regulator n=1 Tax=Pedobacter sp. MC2016-14 TaxID=2897327 RepID=UPI001E654DAA|nr:cyclic nucleotide-binding domain-containing protein [Pedobacter sp. MC2016-14]MCD0490564.1 cyclic nucleotide-binding domain-containing protein [Pedobacter sp. MC2016-14]
MPIVKLSNALNTLHPISTPLKNDLKNIAVPVTEEKAVDLLTIGKPYDRVLFLADGFVKGKFYEESGKKIIARIYQPGAIFTDLQAFFLQDKTSITLTTITKCNLLAIKRDDLRKLTQYPEMDTLKSTIFLLEKGIDFERTKMLMMKPPARFKYFADVYPFTVLPNKICANFLHMYEANYCRIKANYLRG